jgi:hypothetical protein
VELRLWSDADLDVLPAINTPSMKRHLRGPEAEEHLLRRHGRYVEETAKRGADDVRHPSRRRSDRQRRVLAGRARR